MCVECVDKFASQQMYYLYIIYYVRLNLLPNIFFLSVGAIFSGIFFYCDGNYVMYSIMNILSFVYELNDGNLKQRYFEEQTHFF